MKCIQIIALFGMVFIGTIVMICRYIITKIIKRILRYIILFLLYTIKIVGKALGFILLIFPLFPLCIFCGIVYLLVGIIFKIVDYLLMRM